MFRKPLILAAILSAGAAAAQESTSGASSQPAQPGQSSQTGQSGQAAGGEQSQRSQLVTAEMLEEAQIVSLEGEYNENVWQSGEPLSAVVAGLTEIGRVENLVLNVEGQMQGLTTDVGGFLGIATKQVLIPLEDIRLIRPEGEIDDLDELTIITRLNEQQLRELPEFQMGD